MCVLPAEVEKALTSHWDELPNTQEKFIKTIANVDWDRLHAKHPAGALHMLPHLMLPTALRGWFNILIEQVRKSGLTERLSDFPHTQESAERGFRHHSGLTL